MKKDEYLLVTNCSCCGRLASVVLVVEDGHEHIPVEPENLELILALPTYDYQAACELAQVVGDECDAKIMVKKNKTVYNAIKRKQNQDKFYLN